MIWLKGWRAAGWVCRLGLSGWKGGEGQARLGVIGPVNHTDEGGDRYVPVGPHVMVRPALGFRDERKDQEQIAYIDEDFAVVIPPSYDFGWPFEDGVALVCRDCKEEQEGEHTALVGGAWGTIDRQGVEVVPVELARDEAVARRSVN